VDTTPWSNVYLDGQLLGRTPIDQDIVAGVHNLLLFCGECKTLSQKNLEFTIADGEVYAQNIAMEGGGAAAVAVAPVTTAPVATTPTTTTTTTQPATTTPTWGGATTQPTTTQPTAATPPPATTTPVAPPPTTTTPALAATTTPTATATMPVAGQAQFPFTNQKHRMGKIKVKYPLMGYQYSQVPGDCGVDGTCAHFVDVQVTGPGGNGLVMAAESIAFEGEFFPIEFAGITAGYSRVGYKTSHQVQRADGSTANFGDGINQVKVGGRFRLPMLNNRAAGPLDLLFDIGYQGEDFIYFEATAADNAWTYDNFWAHGLWFGLGARFQAAQQVVIHADWHGKAVGSGMISNEIEAGVEIRPYKIVIVDISWLLNSRNVTVQHSASSTETAGINDLYTGVGISGGIIF